MRTKNITDDKVAWDVLTNIRHRWDLPHVLRFLGKNENMVELGVLEGKFSEPLLKNGMPRHFVGLDCWDAVVSPYWTQKEHDKNYASSKALIKNYQKDEKNKQKWRGIEKIEMIKGDHSLLHEQYPDEYFDFVFIDSDHCYEPTVRDIDQWWPKVKKGGIFSGHDYKHRKGRNKFTGEPWQWGVIQAVNEFSDKTSLPFFVTTEQNPSWMFLKPSDYEA